MARRRDKSGVRDVPVELGGGEYLVTGYYTPQVGGELGGFDFHRRIVLARPVGNKHPSDEELAAEAFRQLEAD